jgi:hypothetical protein
MGVAPDRGKVDRTGLNVLTVGVGEGCGNIGKVRTLPSTIPHPGGTYPASVKDEVTGVLSKTCTRSIR